MSSLLAINNILTTIPKNVSFIMDSLKEHGFESYVVGGCVRDALLFKTPKDWDICTNALPEQMIDCFDKKVRIIETGIKHGTITIVLDNEMYEVTTYRVDGEYSDNRRPNEVKFVSNIKDDLSRRDFTINAMAYSPIDGLIDCFGGVADLNTGIIRCVGDPTTRFQEDALRIMRAIRFTSTYGFNMDKETAKAMYQNKGLLCNISKERICSELSKTLCGKWIAHALKYFEALVFIIPEIIPMIDFNQHNKYHNQTAWKHTAISVGEIRNDLVLRLTMLFHDIGKPKCATFEKDEWGISHGHFYGHAEVSATLARNIMKRLKFDNETIENVCLLISYHDVEIANSTKSVKRLLNKIGEDNFRKLLEVKVADTKAQEFRYRKDKFNHIENIRINLDCIINTRQCFTLKDLAINGDDLIKLGIKPGKRIGEILNQLLKEVIDDNYENNKQLMLLAVEDMLYRERIDALMRG